MEEVKIVYKRTSAWWVATCYLLGSIFLLIWAALSLLGTVATYGKEGVVALKEASDEQEKERVISSYVKDDIKLVSFNVAAKLDRATLAVSIKNDSQFAIEKVEVEIANLDINGIPQQTRTEWLKDLSVVYPGDTAHSETEFRLIPGNQASQYSVRIAGFRVLGDNVLKTICANPGTTTASSQ
ncbi:MAG TPA: hypothetical protein VM553_17405 [Dongiaceae bacterium]|nr:hypothetical protein [Dongiaceae bacterium]